MTEEATATRPDVVTPGGRRYLILAICAMSLFIVGIDTTGVNLALPGVARDLGASESQLQWVIDAYTLVLASLLLLGGSMGDRFGRRGTFQTGLVIFGLGSLACSLAPSPEWLITARALQAIGGCMLNPIAMSIITDTFREPAERAKAIGIWGAVFGLSMALGPVIGGALIDALDWRAIFWLNVPVVLLALVLTARFVPTSRAERVRRFDLPGQLLVIVALAALVFSIIEGRSNGWTSAVTLGGFALAAAAVAVLLAVELRVRQPLIDPRFFGSAEFSIAVVNAVLAFASMGGFLFLNTLYLQEVRGLLPLQAGLMTLPMAVMMAVCAPVSGRLVASYGPRLPGMIGGAAIVVGSVLLMSLSNTTSWVYLAVAYIFTGIGNGMLNAPITNSAVAGMPRSQSGVAAAIASTSRQVGTALGVAILPAVAFSQMTGGMQHGFAEATHVGWMMTAAFGALNVALSFAVGTRWAIGTRRHVAVLFR